jgi:UDP-glucose 4-epimerase
VTVTRSWQDRRVLVTGARGFIAGHLCRRLLREGALVHGISRVDVAASHPSIRWSQTDLTDRSQVRRLVQNVRPDVVFHLAGHVTGSQQLEHVAPTLDFNLVSTVHLLTAASETGRCRVVLTGSMQEPEPGDAGAIPCSPYAASKWACTGYARMFQSLYQLPVIIARPFMVYGPGQWDLSKLLPYVVDSLLKGEAPRVSSGNRAMDWVYVDDVVEGLLLVADTDHPDARTIDLGTGELVSIRTIVEQVRSLIDARIEIQFGAIPDRLLERPHAARADETRRETGWTAATPLAEGLTATIDWFRSRLAQGVAH